jgi:tetratricopeptide (TPR) repeat protein
MFNIDSDPPALVRAARNALQQADVAAAETLCRRALSIDPTLTESLALLGAAVNAQARFPEAEKIFTELTRREPQQRLHWMNLGTVLRANAHPDDALAAYARAAALGEASADFYYNVGLLHVDRVDPESARAVFERAHKIAPDDAEICFHYAQSCLDCSRTAEAVAALKGWSEWSNVSTELYAKLSFLLLALGEAKSSEAALALVLANPAPTPLTRLKLAQIYERTNRLAAARQQLDLLHADPLAAQLGEELTLVEAQVAQRESSHQAACERYASVLRGCTDVRLRHFHLFPYAKSLDALHRYD